MSFDLGVWYSSRPMDGNAAAARYVALCGGDLADVEPNPGVAAFLSELTARYPQIDDVAEDEVDECPWNCAFDVSEGHVIMPMAWSRCVEMAPVILGLAEKHGLICFDPQSGEVLLPPQLAE